MTDYKFHESFNPMSEYKVTNLLKELSISVPFVGPETQERTQGRSFIARIGANENVFGPSPLVLEAISKSGKEAWMYGDPEVYELLDAIAHFHKIEPENVMVGEGIDGILGYLARMFVDPGDKVVTSTGAYPTFNYHVNGYGGEIILIPYKEDHEDFEALIKATVNYKAKLLYFANPDNPMGTWWEADYVQDMMKKLPKTTLLIMDEAYSEFAPEGTLTPIDITNKQILRLRTFSKAYGLAGMRIGYAIGNSNLIREFNKVRNHFGVGRVAQAAALAALQDSVYLKQVIHNVEVSKKSINVIAKENGLLPLRSATNFVTIDCCQDGQFAILVLKDLIRQGIFVRMPSVEPLNRCIRVTTGLDEQMVAFAKALPIALKYASSAFNS